MQWLLILAGITVLVASLAMVVVPYLRGTADLLTTWSLFLLGLANFVGISAIQSGTAENHLYGIFGTAEYWRFALGSLIFLAAVSITYYRFKWPRRLAHRRLQKTPPVAITPMLFAMCVCAVLTFGGIQAPNVQFIGQILIFVGLSAANFAGAFAFYIWDDRRLNPAALLILAGGVGLGILSSLGQGNGRIYVLSTLMTVPFCWYWKTLRHKPLRNTLIPLGVALLLTFFIIQGYSVIRHARRDRDASAAQLAISRLKAIPEAFDRGRGGTSLFGGDTTDVSLLAIQRYTQVAKPQPFFTLIYVLSNPIPRAWWPDKVGSLGEALPRETGIWSRSGYISLGPGIVGHGYHEGGLHMLVFYGFLIGSALRFIDEILATRNDNPFIVGMIASVGGFFFALPRGELGLYMIHIISGFLTGVLLILACRLLFGTVDRRAPWQPYVAENEDHPHQGEYAAWE
jgi:hypothetical protein